jgi:hypothetical protein
MPPSSRTSVRAKLPLQTDRRTPPNSTNTPRAQHKYLSRLATKRSVQETSEPRRHLTKHERPDQLQHPVFKACKQADCQKAPQCSGKPHVSGAHNARVRKDSHTHSLRKCTGEQPYSSPMRTRTAERRHRRWGKPHAWGFNTPGEESANKHPRNRQISKCPG